MCFQEDGAGRVDKGQSNGSLVFELRYTSFLALPGYSTMATDALSSILAITVCTAFSFVSNRQICNHILALPLLCMQLQTN